MKKFEIYLRRVLLKLLMLFKSSAKNTELVKVKADSRILFIRLNRIGDALVTTPLIKEVKEKFGCSIYVLADKKNSFIFQNNKNIDKVFVYKKGLKGLLELIKMLNSLDLDIIVDLHDDISTTVTYILALTKSRNKFGLSKANETIYTHTVNKLDPSKIHIIDRVMELSKLFQINTDKKSINVHYCLLEESKSKADKFIRANFNNKKFLTGINISAGSKARFWGTDNYKKIIQYLLGKNTNVLLLCSPSDISLAKEISNDKICLYYSNSFDEFSAVIARLNLLFTPDTSIVHIASSFRIPMFGLYVNYNTTDMIWTPYKSDFDCVITKEPNLENVSFNEVINKFEQFLAKYNL